MIIGSVLLLSIVISLLLICKSGITTITNATLIVIFNPPPRVFTCWEPNPVLLVQDGRLLGSLNKGQKVCKP